MNTEKQIKIKSGCNCKPHCIRIRRYFYEYCDHTSIHGIQYFSQKRTLYEKIYWFVTIVLSISFLGVLIYGLAMKFISMPVIVSFSTKETPVYEVPFPTVTICSKAKISADKFNYTHVMTKVRKSIPLTEKERVENNYAALFCEDEFRRKSLRNNTYDDFVSEDIYTFLNETKRNFFHFCYLMGSKIPCEDILVPIVTDEGVCYSFNFLNHSEIFQDNVYAPKDFYQAPEKSSWSIEKGYSDPRDLSAYPIRSLLTGITKSLSVVLYSKKSNVDMSCSSDDAGGYLVNIAIPGKLPLMSDTTLTIGSNMNVIAALEPTVMKTSQAVRDYLPEKRDCVFQHEKLLKYFKIYTQSNCILECFTNMTLKMCHCVAPFMPRFNGTKLCGVASYNCIEDAELEYLVGDLLHKTNADANETMYYDECLCMPMCSDINYNLEISQNPWRNTKFVKKRGEERKYTESVEELDEVPEFIIEENESVDFASLTLFMKRNHLETKERNEVYGFIDFISGFGGLLGLFTGFSILSGMEILYFLTLRMFGNCRLRGTWHGEEDSLQEIKTA